MQSQRVVVVGGTRGIGHAVAQYLAGLGASVAGGCVIVSDHTSICVIIVFVFFL